MTHKEENIVNISMCAGLLLKDGRIDLDDNEGFAGLTDYVISLAEKFEKVYAGVDWNSDERDYWIEIDDFAEKELIERYGRSELVLALEAYGYDAEKSLGSEWVQRHKEAFLNAFREGVEEIDLDFWIQYEELLDENLSFGEYRFVDRLYEGDPLELIDVELTEEERQVFAEIKTSLANHRTERAQQNEDPVKVYAVAGSVKNEIYSGNLDECKAFCEENRWTWVDENQFHWDMEIEDSRESLLPDDYYNALYYYETNVGRAFDGELTRVNAEKFVFCYHHELDINNFDFWVRYEELCGEELTYDEYKAAEAMHGGSPYDIGDEEFEKINAVKRSVNDFRTAQVLLNKASELDQLIKAAKAQMTAPESGCAGENDRTTR